MFPYHLTHLALPTIHLKPQKETVLHSSFPLSPCRHSLPLLPESNLRHLECPHADRVPRGPPHDTLVAMIPLSNGHTAPSRALAVVNLRHREGLHADAILNRISRTAACRLSPGASHDLYSSCTPLRFYRDRIYDIWNARTLIMSPRAHHTTHL